VDEDYVTSFQGPVEKIDGKLVLRIPLEAGALNSSIVHAAISEIAGSCLKTVDTLGLQST
jgi:hypothetical protein